MTYQLFKIDYRLSNIHIGETSNNMVVDTINVGLGPTHLEYSPANDNIYVANEFSDDVSIIPS
jgi:DNA-binding beta-propeller fold protein YncE